MRNCVRRRRPAWPGPACLIASIAVSLPLRAQAVLEFDHATGKARLLVSDSAKPVDVRSGESIRVTWPGPIRLRVVNGNTAIYRYSVETREAPPPPEAVTGRLGEFLRQFRPYLPEVVLAVAGPATPGRPRGDVVYRSLLPSSPPEASDAVRLAWNAGREAELALAVLDDRLHGRGGLDESKASVLTTLEQMRGGGSVETLSLALADSLAMQNRGCGAGGADRLPLTNQLLVAIQNLIRARRSLTQATAIAGPELFGVESQRVLRDSLMRISALADTAATDYQSIVSAAYAFERLALPVAHACASWNGRAVALSEMERRTLTLKVDVSGEPEVARVATKSASTFSITLVQSPLVISSLGVSALVAPDATYPVYATRSATGGVEIFESSVRDIRFTWGVTFGAGWRISDQLSARGVRLWLPEITFNPASDVRALGLGSAISFGMIKVGAGALWARHPELLGQSVGSVIPTKDHLRVADVYGKRKLYFSLSVFDVPPFVGGAK